MNKIVLFSTNFCAESHSRGPSGSLRGTLLVLERANNPTTYGSVSSYGVMFGRQYGKTLLKNP